MKRTARLLAAIPPVLTLLSCGEAGILAPAAGASLVVRPEIAGGTRHLAAISTPYSPTSIYHLTVKVFSVAPDNLTESQVAVSDLPGDGLKNAVLTFSALKLNTHYRVRGYAYLSPGTGQQISTDASSQLDVTTTNDQNPVIATLPVALVDQTFNASTQTSIGLTAGGFASAGLATLAGTPIISTVMGTGTAGYVASQDVGLGLATRAELNTPGGVAADGLGNTYVVDPPNNRVCLISGTTGNMSVVAGTGVAGFSGDGGLAVSARLSNPTAITVDFTSGNLFISDTGNNRIREVCKTSGTYSGLSMAAGGIYTIAGGGASFVDGVVGTASSLASPSGITANGLNSVAFMDTNNGRIRQINNLGTITTLAGNGSLGYLGDNGDALSAEFGGACSLHLNNTTQVLCIADTVNNRVRVVAPATASYYGLAMTYNYVYTIAGGGASYADNVLGTASTLSAPGGVTADGVGYVYVADTGNQRVRRVDPSGFITTAAGSATVGFAGDGSTAIGAQLNAPIAVSTENSGTRLFIADKGNQRVRVVSHTTATFFAQAMIGNNIYTVAGNGEAGGLAFPDSGTGLATSAQLNNPNSLALDGAGNLYVADVSNQRVRRISASTGVASTYAGSGIAGSGGDGGPAKAAQLNGILGLAADASGNLYIADASSNRVREVVAATGLITAFAGTGAPGFTGDGAAAIGAKLQAPQGLGLDASGNLYISDGANQRIRMVCQTAGTYFGLARTKGFIYTLTGDGTTALGGEGTSATTTPLNSPLGIAFDAAGNLYFAESGRARIRAVCQTAGTYFGVAMTAGNVYTVAGTGTGGFGGDNGPATSAKLSAPAGVGLDQLGNLYIADQGNNRIRLVTPAGTISTFAGSGSTGYTGDGGAATAAGMSTPLGLAVSPKGVVYFSDKGHHAVRKVQ